MQQQEAAIWLLVPLAFGYCRTAAIIECWTCSAAKQALRGFVFTKGKVALLGMVDSPLTVSNAGISVKWVKREEIFLNGGEGLILH